MTTINDALFSKAGAKVLLFFGLCKYFFKKNQKSSFSETKYRKKTDF